jgi:hypothetical protein
MMALERRIQLPILGGLFIVSIGERMMKKRLAHLGSARELILSSILRSFRWL